MTASATLFVVDPDETVITMVREIAKEMRIGCESFARAEVFLAAYTDDRPGCLLTEFRLLGMNGLELQESLAADCSSLPIVFVAAKPEIRISVQAMQNGAVTVLEKPLSHQELWDSVHRALRRDAHARRIDAKHSIVRRRLSMLSAKERQVLDLMIQGKANKVIASRLDVSVRTVEARRHQIFAKTKTESIAELVRLILMSDPTDDADTS
ncbi:MAG: response regulator transcription factor [Planctomycetaceae bacterium]|nr:response regulator transcription factor [Planctomycetales bacterium]MCB9873025.1 response regulator transcription factor [Planctomycetaceae bacterium]MCB9937018.1 response regulator transcription factor [Planctomycetaceae bacterium]HRX81213.1 LuxR C-terminal-related transcriptional regulator [Pirellulaceae bacterium]